MAKAKKKAKAKARLAPERGMYLTVHIGGGGYSSDDEMDNEFTVRSFHDITRAGHKVARAVRDYLRHVPMFPHVRAWSITVWPTWTQTAPASPGKHDDAQRSSDVEALEDLDG